MPDKITLNKNDIVEADITDMGINGEGVAHAEGAVVFVRGAITGERVRAKIIYAGKNYCVALLDKILKRADCRTDAPCPYFPKCGGCSLQHIDYSAQTVFKTESLKNTLKKQGVSAENVLSAVKSDKKYFYRNKLTLPVRYPDKIGFFRAESHSVVEIADCMLQNFDCKSVISALKNFMAESGLCGYDEESGSGDIRHISVRRLSEIFLICLVATHDLSERLAPFCDALKTLFGENFSLYLNINTKRTNVIFSDKFVFAGGKENPETEIDGLKVIPHPAAFFQVNDCVREMLYSAAEEEVKNFSAVIDAYSGAGLLSARISRKAEKVIGVEINEQAHAAALSLVKINGIKNLTPICGDCAEKIPTVLERTGDGKDVALLLDPPRSGVSANVIDAIIKAKPRKIVYISCNPATLARDLKLLSGEYEIRYIRPYDMFPQTPSLEILTVLENKRFLDCAPAALRSK